MEILGSYFMPIAVAIVAIVVLMSILGFVKRNLVKVPPSEVVVVSGPKTKMTVTDATGHPKEVTVEYKLVKGGRVLIIPFLHRKDQLDLRTITIPNLQVKDVVTKEGVKITAKAVANVKIGSEDTLLANAVEQLLGKTQEEIKNMAYQTLEGHLRAMLATLTVEQINRDRASFAQKMMDESQMDLAKLGLKVVVLTITEISDEHGYLEAMGMQRTAEIKRDAEVGKANAEREQTIQSTTAQREGEVQKQNNLAQELLAQKDTNVKKADYDAETKAAEARAAQANPLATAEARKAVVEAEQEVILAQTRKATEVALAEADRTEKALLATTVRPAEAKKLADIAKAEGEARAVEITADAAKKKAVLEGEGVAAAIKAKLLAEADGIRAKLLAEAEGILKKAEAYKELNKSGQLLQILEAAQTLVPSAIKEFAAVMSAAAAPLGNADKIVVVDGGGNGHNGGSALERYTNTAPQLVFGLLQKAAAMGFDLGDLLGRAGVTVEDGAAVGTSGAAKK